MTGEPLGDRFTKILLIVLSIAFSGWSVAVWKAVDKIDVVATDLRLIAEKLRHLDDTTRGHIATPWHSKAGEAIIRLQEQRNKQE